MSPDRPSLSIQLPPIHGFYYNDGTTPKTPQAQQDEEKLAIEPPPRPGPHPQTFKVKRKRRGAPLQEPLVLDMSVIPIPTIETSEVETRISSPSLQPTSAHLLSPIPHASSLSRAITPPKTPAPRLCTPFSQLESPADEWDLITNTKPTFQRANSVCSSFSDSSVSSCGSSAFSMPTGGYDSPSSETTDPFLDDQRDKSIASTRIDNDTPQMKRIKTRRHVQWTAQMDDHLWMTFMAYLSDPTLTPFKMLPGSTPPMGVCDQVATKAKRTWRSRKITAAGPGSIDAMLEIPDGPQCEGSPDTIRPSSLQLSQPKWPKAAATRRRLRELCAKRPSISAHYARMLRTRSPSPFDTSSEATQPVQPASLSSSLYDLHKSLMTSTAPSMQPGGVLAQLASDEPPPAPRQTRQPRPEGWFDRIPRSKAHQKSASLQSELRIHVEDMDSRAGATLSSPFDAGVVDNRSHLLHSMATTKSLGRTEFNGRSLDSPFDFKVGAPTDRRSRKRRFRSDEEKPRRGALEDVFGPPVQQRPLLRNRGFSVGTTLAADHLTNLFTPPSATGVDHEMADALVLGDDVPMGSRSAPRRMIEPVPRLLSPFVETPPPSRQHNTFPRINLLPTSDNQAPFHQQLLQLQHEHARNAANQS